MNPPATVFPEKTGPVPHGKKSHSTNATSPVSSPQLTIHPELFEHFLSDVLSQGCQTTDWDFGEVWLPSETTNTLVCSSVCYGQDVKNIQAFRQQSLKLQFNHGEGKHSEGRKL